MSSFERFCTSDPRLAAVVLVLSKVLIKDVVCEARCPLFRVCFAIRIGACRAVGFHTLLGPSMLVKGESMAECATDSLKRPTGFVDDLGTNAVAR